MLSNPNKYPIIAGRWQPFHKGHLWAIKKIISVYNHVIIMVVNIDPLNPPANKFDRFLLQTNPFDFWERYFLIKKTLITEKLWNNVTIIPGWHPREAMKGELFCLPQKNKRIWVVPVSSEEELAKVKDFESNGEIVIKIENIPSEIMEVNATVIRNGIIDNTETWKQQIPENIHSLNDVIDIKSKILAVFRNEKFNNAITSNFSTAICIGEFLPFQNLHLQLLQTLISKYDTVTLCPVQKVTENSPFNWPDLTYTNINLPFNFWDINELIRISLLDKPEIDSKVIIHPLLVKENSYHINLNNLPSNRDWYFLNQSYSFIEKDLLEKDENILNKIIEKELASIADLNQHELTDKQTAYIESLNLQSRLKAISLGHTSTSKNIGNEVLINIDIGILTIVTSEKLAVKEYINNSKEVIGKVNPNRKYIVGNITGKEGIKHSVALLSQSEMGQTAAATAYNALVSEFNPKILILIGIAGSINKKVDLCDVVISDGVIHYDKRKETAQGDQHRGKTINNSPFVKNLVDNFFELHTEYPSFKAVANSKNENYRVHRGLVGSGEKVVTKKDSDIITYLTNFNDKTLCVETEGYGFSLPFEEEGGKSNRKGVIIIRGISDQPLIDNSDKDKFRKQCSGNAVQTMLKVIKLIPKIE